MYALILAVVMSAQVDSSSVIWKKTQELKQLKAESKAQKKALRDALKLRKLDSLILIEREKLGK